MRTIIVIVGVSYLGANITEGLPAITHTLFGFLGLMAFMADMADAFTRWRK
jgi:hypothetical protein